MSSEYKLIQNNIINNDPTLLFFDNDEFEEIKTWKNIVKRMNLLVSNISLKILKYLYIIKKDQETLNNKEIYFLKKIFLPNIKSPHIDTFKNYLNLIYKNFGNVATQHSFFITALEYLKEDIKNSSYIGERTMIYYERVFSQFLKSKDKKNYNSFINSSQTF